MLEKNKRLEAKITRWYGNAETTRVWIAKHYYRFITSGCTQNYVPCHITEPPSNINEPKGFQELAEYCFNHEVYGRHYRAKLKGL